MANDKLEEEILRLLDILKTYSPGSEEYAKATKDLQILYKLKIEQFNSEVDGFDKEESRRINEEKNSSDADLKKRQIRAEILRAVMECLKTGAICMLQGFWIFKILRFEETGVITTKLFNVVMPKLPKFW